MNFEITSEKEYNNIYNRINQLITILDKNNHAGKLTFEDITKKVDKLTLLLNRFMKHKKSILYSNPLQILVSEGIYKIKVSLQYKNQYVPLSL